MIALTIAFFSLESAKTVGFFHPNCFVDILQLVAFCFMKKRRQFLKFFKICHTLRYMLRHIMVYTLIDHSSRPMSAREISQLWYKVPFFQVEKH